MLDSHDVSHIYGKPSQEELDRMFGLEVGDASHYQKKCHYRCSRTGQH